MILNSWEHESRQISDTADVIPCLCGGGSSHCHCQHYVLVKENHVERMERQTGDKCANVQKCGGGV